MKKIHLAIIAAFPVLLMTFSQAAFGFAIHDLDYENSPYDNKTMPVVDAPMRLDYQVVNNTPQSHGYNVTISIRYVDNGTQVYRTIHHYDIKSNNFEDIIWNFTPNATGLYVVVATENSTKTVNYVFAVTKDGSFRKEAKKDPAILDNKSPLEQFRLGIDPKEIKCKDGYFLSLKPSSLPVCSSLETLKELRQRNLVIADAIDYDKIGYVESEDQFKKMLAEKNIEYSSDKFLLITGMSLLTLPPTTDYCGYVQDKIDIEHWFSSSYHYDNLTSAILYDKNPSPCQPNTMSCFCSLQTKLAERNPELSYFTKHEEEITGTVVSNYLDGTKIANVSNQFIVGKYNLESSSADIHYCGRFTGGVGLKDFEGYIKNDKVVAFSLASEKSKLCAISDDAKTFTFNKSSIVPDTVGGK
ncbi:MAG TPA: hypothetical protein VJR22_05880 [Candidatus Nitrosotalea sp.]|nr:hypothetical protein [Candidatus Nitrosotalea sp.]